MAKTHEMTMKNAVRRRTTRLLDEDGRTRAILHCNGEDSTLTLFDEQGRRHEVIRGLPQVYSALQQMQEDPDCQSEIVRSDPPVTFEHLLSLPPAIFCQWIRLSQEIERMRARLQAMGRDLPADFQAIAPWEEGVPRSQLP